MLKPLVADLPCVTKRRNAIWPKTWWLPFVETWRNCGEVCFICWSLQANDSSKFKAVWMDPKSSNCDMLWNRQTPKNFNGEITMTIRVFLQKTWVHPFHTKIKVDWSGNMSSCRILIEPLGPGRLPKSALHESKITFFSAGYLDLQEAFASVNCPTLTYFFTNFHYETYFCRLALQKHLNFTVSLRSKVTWKKVFWTETIFQKNKILSKPTFFRRGDTETHFQMFFSGYLGPPPFFW